MIIVGPFQWKILYSVLFCSLLFLASLRGRDNGAMGGSWPGRQDWGSAQDWEALGGGGWQQPPALLTRFLSSLHPVSVRSRQLTLPFQHTGRFGNAAGTCQGQLPGPPLTFLGSPTGSQWMGEVRHPSFQKAKACPPALLAPLQGQADAARSPGAFSAALSDGDSPLSPRHHQPLPGRLRQ